MSRFSVTGSGLVATTMVPENGSFSCATSRWQLRQPLSVTRNNTKHYAPAQAPSVNDIVALSKCHWPGLPSLLTNLTSCSWLWSRMSLSKATLSTLVASLRRSVRYCKCGTFAFDSDFRSMSVTAPPSVRLKRADISRWDSPSGLIRVNDRSRSDKRSSPCRKSML